MAVLVVVVTEIRQQPPSRYAHSLVKGPLGLYANLFVEVSVVVGVGLE